MKRYQSKAFGLTMCGFVLAFLLAPSVALAEHSRAEMKSIIERAEETANDFDDDFDDALDHTPLKGTDEKDRLDQQAEALEDTLDKIRDKFGDEDEHFAVRGLVERALAIAADIDRVVQRYHLDADVEGDWVTLRNTLNAMARYYNLNSRI